MTTADSTGRLNYNETLADEISALAELPEGTVWRDLGGSWATNLLAISADGGSGTVFRVHQLSTSSARLRAEQKARRVLALAGIPTVEPLPLFDGDYVGRIHTGHLVEAERFVVSDGQMKTPDFLIRGFTTLGSIHRCLAHSELPAAAHTVAHANYLAPEEAVAATTAGAERISSWDEPTLTAYADAVVEHVDRVRALEEQIEQHRQVVHGDFWDNNVLFAGTELVAVLDFGFMSERARVDDLALSVWFYLLEPGRGAPGSADIGLVAAMLDAYDRGGTPLTRQERLAMPLAIARQPAWSVGRWVLHLDEQHAIGHARHAARELPIAQAVLRDLNAWQKGLTRPR